MKIELRWLERDVENLDPMTNIAHGRPRETVLQFRQEYNAYVGGYDPSKPMPVVPKWGEWQDIPTVKEKPKPISNFLHTPSPWPFSVS